MKYTVNFDIELKKNPYSGLYIALEGIDGSGKTTQVELLAKEFEKQGKEVIRTHEPRRESVVGKLVHEILTAKVNVPPVSLQYLFAADRAIHQEQIVIPALQSGKVVISDRNFWSAIPYGLLDRSESGKEENTDQLLSALSILSMYHEFIVPDKTFIMDIGVEQAASRLEKKGKDAEIYEKREKLEKLKAGYEFLLEKFSDVLIRVDAEGEVNKITQDIFSKIT